MVVMDICMLDMVLSLALDIVATTTVTRAMEIVNMDYLTKAVRDTEVLMAPLVHTVMAMTNMAVLMDH